MAIGSRSSCWRATGKVEAPSSTEARVLRQAQHERDLLVRGSSVNVSDALAIAGSNAMASGRTGCIGGEALAAHQAYYVSARYDRAGSRTVVR